MSADFDSPEGSAASAGEIEPTAVARLQTALFDLLSEMQSREQKIDVRYTLLCERLAALESRLPTIQPADEQASPAKAELPTRAEPPPRPAPAERPAKTPSPLESAAGYGEWENVLFGLEMASTDSMSGLRSALIADLLRGDCAALAFLGHLLLFRSAAADRMAPLLKELGESYYAWSATRSEAAESERKAFVAWLVRRCAAVGVTNVIELVHVGDRIDLARHYATGRGVDVAAVHGWVVLRDNGKVYTKAAVTAR